MASIEESRGREKGGRGERVLRRPPRGDHGQEVLPPASSGQSCASALPRAVRGGERSGDVKRMRLGRGFYSRRRVYGGPRSPRRCTGPWRRHWSAWRWAASTRGLGFSWGGNERGRATRQRGDRRCWRHGLRLVPRELTSPCLRQRGGAVALVRLDERVLLRSFRFGCVRRHDGDRVVHGHVCSAFALDWTALRALGTWGGLG
jgi:hypothetical protein